MNKNLLNRWNKVKLGDICDFSQGIQVAIDNQHDKKEENYVRFLRIIDYTQNKDEVRYIEYPGDKYIVNLSDVVMIRYGDAGRVVRGYEGAIANNLFKITTKFDNLTNDYLYYFLSQNKVYGRLINSQQKTGLPAVNFKTVSDIDVLYPESLEEQERIVSILERAEDAICKREESLALLDELVKSKFIEMFGKSEDTTAIELDKVSIKITDGTHQSPKFVNEGIPFLFVSNIVNNKIDYRTERFISREEYELLIKRTPIEIGDILLTSVGSYGNPAIVESVREFCFQRHIAYIKPNKEYINSYYLHSVLQTPYVRNQIDRKVKGIAQKTLNLSELKKIRINIPSIYKQKEFENFYKQVDKLKFEMEKSLEELQKNFNSLSQKSFNGEL